MPRDRERFFIRSGPKLPPPAHGIKAKRAGTTWWGQRWIEALVRIAPAYASRLERGRSYARNGRTHDLEVGAGSVTALVTGSRPKPYAVSLKLAQLTAAEWTKVIEALAAHAAFSAELLAGSMPESIDDAFAAAGVSLFPKQARDLVTDCNCPDWANPCKHVAACHYVLGEAFDRDPFLLFELRGRTREQVLDALRAARSGGDAADELPADSGVPRTMALSALDAAEYDKPRAELPRLALKFEPPAVHGAILEQLGKPAAWSGEASPAELLAPLVRAAAERARAIALADEPPSTPVPQPRPRRKASKRTR
ncbi:MAG TPA: hypothetical protein VJR89_36055 [Polyangiales bacterium]|nr:hypothetical protein [Polyangiales bacterium]